MKRNLTYDIAYLDGFVSDKDMKDAFKEVGKAHELLVKRNGPGKDFLGWMDLPENIDEGLLRDIEGTAGKLNRV